MRGLKIMKILVCALAVCMVITFAHATTSYAATGNEKAAVELDSKLNSLGGTISLRNISGNFYLLYNGRIIRYTGFVPYAGRYFYFVGGKYMRYTGLVPYGSKKVYVVGGMFYPVTNIVKSGNQLVYVKDGFFVPFTGQMKINDKVWNLVGGIVNSATTSADNKETSTQNTNITGVFNLVNQARRNAGISTLTLDSQMNKAAYTRAVEISEYFSHTRPDGRSCSTVARDYNIDWSYWGENIAAGYSTPSAAMNGWMNSTGHRENILSTNYRYIGIGYYYDRNTEYRHYWVQIFK